MVEGALNGGAGVQWDLRLVESRQFLYSLCYQSKRNVKTHASKLQKGPMEDKEHKVIKLKGSQKHTSRDTWQRQQRRCSQAALGSFHLPKQDNKVGQEGFSGSWKDQVQANREWQFSFTRNICGFQAGIISHLKINCVNYFITGSVTNQSPRLVRKWAC